MNKREKVEFVNDLMGSIREGIVASIESGKVPECWNGHQLRMLIAEKAQDAAWLGTENLARRRAYRNDVIINNL